MIRVQSFSSWQNRGGISRETLQVCSASIRDWDTPNSVMSSLPPVSIIELMMGNKSVRCDGESTSARAVRRPSWTESCDLSDIKQLNIAAEAADDVLGYEYFAWFVFNWSMSMSNSSLDWLMVSVSFMKPLATRRGRHGHARRIENAQSCSVHASIFNLQNLIGEYVTVI